MQAPNVLLVVLDARGDFCSCYGGAQTLTPALDALAEEGVVFENAFAAAPWTLPAMASILTGLPTSQNDVEAQRQLSPAIPTLAEQLRAAGYATWAITKNSWFNEFGLTTASTPSTSCSSSSNRHRPDRGEPEQHLPRRTSTGEA
ncbi:MAG: sulfatase-like hydrolase/transferase [Caldilineaceae bacterium]